MPLVQVSLKEGRTPQQIRRLITELTAAVVRSVDAPGDTVRVIVTEVPPAHWAAGDVTLEERASGRPEPSGTR
jgi:4-oxalocrotonate tautomerase